MKEVEIESIEEVPESPDWKGIINTILNVVLVIACVVYVIRFLSLTAQGAVIETAPRTYTEITDKPDGVNTRTRVVDDNGYVQSERITLAHVPEKYVGEPTGEIPEWANEGGTPITRYFIREGERYVVDDIDYILVSPSSWQELTNAVERLRDIAAERWRMEHETANGRAMWHGKETNRVVTAQGITWLYRDGYTYFEAAEKVPRERPRKAQKTAPGQHAPNLPPRLAEKREAMKSRAGRVREVNATFGPGGKVLKVEDVK